MRGRLWLLAASVAVAVLVGPGLAGAGGLGNSVSATGPDNESATAWFVQLAGSPTAEGASAMKYGDHVTKIFRMRPNQDCNSVLRRFQDVVSTVLH